MSGRYFFVLLLLITSKHLLIGRAGNIRNSNKTRVSRTLFYWGKTHRYRWVNRFRGRLVKRHKHPYSNKSSPERVLLSTASAQLSTSGRATRRATWEFLWKTCSALASKEGRTTGKAIWHWCNWPTTLSFEPSLLRRSRTRRLLSSTAASLSGLMADLVVSLL